MGKTTKGKSDKGNKHTSSSSSKNGGKLSQWAKIKIVCKVVRGKLQKAHTMGYLTVPGQESGRGLTRLSSSCPSLNVEGEEIDDEDTPSCKSGASSIGGVPPHRGSIGGENTSSPTTPLTSGSLDDTHLCPDTPKIRVNDSTPTGSEEFLLDARKGPRGMSPLDQNRRKSWSGLSDEEKKRARQRSVSLSSLDSDTEEPFFDADDGAHTQGSTSPVNYSNRGTGGGSSTHSLNEVHLDKKSASSTEKPRLLTPRLTLQKSISTPSILAGVVNNQQPQKQAQPLSYQYDDEHSSSKRRKRGSLFFRKKKDKAKKSSHQFVTVCYSNSRTCDVCSKPMTNKPALRCETCLVCVHENTCRDQISDCSKLKNPKVIQKPATNNSSSAGLSNATKSASLGSTPSAPGASSTSTGAKNHANSRSRQSASYGSFSSSSPTKPYNFHSQSKIAGDDRETIDTSQDVPEANILETNSASMESLDDVTDTPTDSALESIDSDPELRLLESEPELWVNTVDKEVVSQLTEKQVKKQEHIYELIITEKHHCRMLKIMKELFAEGMSRELGLKETQIKSIFPCLDELITIHFNFLWRLRERQRMGRYIATIGDLLLEQFVGDNAQGLKDAYGLFCSRHQDAVSNYKELLKTDRRFQTFIRTKSGHHLMKKKGIPECILFVTHRVTKYPLMIEAIIKYSKDQPEETATLKKALDCVKDILVNINAQVAEKEKRQRLLEIYHKIDAKSSTMYKDHKFKKSDLLTDGRKLMFEGQAILSQQRGKQLIVVVVVMSDLIFFLQESNQKYYFVSPDNKAGAIPLGKLLVREKAGQDTRSIYLISGNQNEMFEFECSHPKDKRIWLESIREAVEKCPDDELGIGIRRLIEANSERIHELLLGMQHHDKELARMCEDKMKLITELVAALGGDVSALPSPDYRVLLEESNLDHESAKELQINSLQEALRLVGSASGWGTNLARSVSSVGEHQSEAYVSPSLPKRAETFGGFDNPNKDNPVLLSKQSGTKKKKDSKISLLSTDTSSTGDATDCLKNRRPSGSSLTVRSSQDNLSITSAQSGESSGQQQTLAAHLVQCLNTALVLSHHHLTQYEIYRAKLATGTSIDGRFSHSQKLEELRNIQEQISHERAQWTREREHQEKWITDKREELKRLQENLRSQQEDINQQREDLYRKLEALNNQGIVLNPCLTVLTSSHLNANETTSPSCDVIAPSQSPHTSPTTVAPRTIRTDSKLRNSTASLSGVKRDSNTSLPTHLISAANQQKGAVVAVKQQLPMKLAKLGAVGSSSSSSTSSMSSSLSSSLGGSMSPSQDKELPSKGYSTISYVTSHVSPSSVQQMLPLKLSEGSTGESKTGVSRLIGGYQRLASPPHAPSNTEGQGGLGANNTNSSSSHLHQRTGSSPASLQNGAALPLSSVSGYVPSVINSSVAVAVAGGRATRTHTYPKLAARPNPPQANAPSDSSSKENSPGHTGQPGQRIKDPDTDQEIIFF